MKRTRDNNAETMIASTEALTLRKLNGNSMAM
jgi:hypothetical protein